MAPLLLLGRSLLCLSVAVARAARPAAHHLRRSFTPLALPVLPWAIRLFTSALGSVSTGRLRGRFFTARGSCRLGLCRSRLPASVFSICSAVCLCCSAVAVLSVCQLAAICCCAALKLICLG